MTDAVLNLCRVKMRDQQRVMKGPMPEYPNEEFGDFVPRAGNASGGGQPERGLALLRRGGANDLCLRDHPAAVLGARCWTNCAAARS